LKNDIDHQLMEIIKNHPGLRELRERRHREEIANKLQDSKPLADILENLIKKSPTLSKLFIEGVNIRNPFNLTGAGVQEDFNGKRYPTYFKLHKEYTEKAPKNCPRNKNFRVQFETDVENIYFHRDIDPGEFTLYCSESEIENYTLNLWNGIASLTVDLPESVKVGDKLLFKVTVTDSTRAEAFENEFYVEVLNEEQKNNGNNGDRHKSSNKDDGDKKQPSSLSLPEIFEIREGHEEYKHQNQALIQFQNI